MYILGVLDALDVLQRVEKMKQMEKGKLEKMSGQCDGVWQKEEGTMGKDQEEKWKLVAGGNNQYKGITWVSGINWIIILPSRYIPYSSHTAFASLEPGSV